MPERRIEVRTVMVHWDCECGGLMEPTCGCLPMSPPKFPHKCDKCGHEETSYKRYPYVEYKEIGES